MENGNETGNLVRPIKWRAALIVNSINRLKLEIKIDKLLSFLPSTTRGTRLERVWKKGRGGKNASSRIMKVITNEMNDRGRESNTLFRRRTPFVSEWNETIDTGRREGEDGYLRSLSVQSLRSSVAYGTEITCSNNRWFWKRQLIEEGCNLRPSNAFSSPFPLTYLAREREN